MDSNLKFHTEKEVSFKIEIPTFVYNELMCYMENLNCETITKFNYCQPNGFRVIFGKNYTCKQIKYKHSQQENFMYYKNKFIFQTKLTKSTEETVDTHLLEDDNFLESSIQRAYIYNDKTTRRLRIGLEKKFNTKYSKQQSSQQQPSTSKPDSTNILSLDKWVRLASQTFLHVEYEFDGDNDSAFVQFQQELESSPIFEKIMRYISIVCENVSLNSLIENKLDNFSRNFTTTLTEQPVYVAPKLDGIRKTCTIHQNRIIIDSVKNLKIGVKIAQPIKCHIEIVDGVYYIIDILEIWGPKNIYIKPTHLQAIQIIQSKFIQQIVIEGHLLTNIYYSPGMDLPLTTIRNDGLLMFTKTQIVKYKEHTVDLILKRPTLKREKGAGSVTNRRERFFTSEYSTITTTANSNIDDDQQDAQQQTNYLMEELLFADQTPFSSVFPCWTVEIDMNLNDIFKHEAKPDNDDGSITAPAMSIRNFIILEFKVDYPNKKIIFIKRRVDKMQANTQHAMHRMFDY